MGSYHNNLKDEAVARRVKIAQKNSSGILKFQVRKAGKTFVISTIIEKSEEPVYEVEGIKFTLVEQKNQQNVQ